jgi:hypothetical protein
MRRLILAFIGLLLTPFATAQVIGVQPTPMAMYQWQSSDVSWHKVSNSYTLFPSENTPQPFAFYGWNSSLGQWVPCDVTTNSCPSLFGPGGGCPDSSIVDTAVLTVHPASTCAGSIDFTWDDGASKQNLLVGDGSSTIGDPTATEVYMVGANNTAAAPPGAFNPVSQIAVIGDLNHVQTANETYIIGTENSALSTDAYDFSNSDLFIFGNSNSMSGSGIGGMMILGSENQAVSTGSGIGQVYVLGTGNTFEDTRLRTTEVQVVGESNDVDGSVSTVQVLGYLNRIRDVSPLVIRDTNTVVVGSGIFASGTGSTGTRNAYATAVGQLIYEHDCSDCIAIGSGVEEAASTHMSIGMSRTGELGITRSNVQRTPLTLALPGPIGGAFDTSTHILTGNPQDTCIVTFNNGTGSGGTGIITIDGLKNPGTPILITNGGSYSVAPTQGDLTNGTATTCTGTVGFTAFISVVPACTSQLEGSFAAITDSTVNTWGTTIAGGGSNHVFGYCDGTNWTVAAK